MLATEEDRCMCLGSQTGYAQVANLYMQLVNFSMTFIQCTNPTVETRPYARFGLVQYNLHDDLIIVLLA